MRVDKDSAGKGVMQLIMELEGKVRDCRDKLENRREEDREMIAKAVWKSVKREVIGIAILAGIVGAMVGHYLW